MHITIRRGNPEDTESFICLLQEVRQNMGHKEWFYLDPPEEIRKMMADGTMRLWVAVDGDRIVGAFDILIPGLEPYNYGYSLGFGTEELLRVVNMDTVVVHPDYRGMRLQKRLMQCAESDITQEGSCILLCTVHPDNTFSLNNVLKQGYVIEKKLPMYGSVRYILRKDLDGFQKKI